MIAERTDGWFDPLARFLGAAYLRNAFTMGTEQEVAFLVEVLALEEGQRVLDIGCGPGRHALALARRGFDVVGVDRSEAFIALAREAAGGLPATFELLDVRDLAYDAEFDAAICLCQGGFGLLRGEEGPALVRRFAEALRPGGRLALSAFSAYFAAAHLEEGEVLEAGSGVLRELSTLRDSQGVEEEFEMWTTVFTPRELALIAEAAGLDVEGVYGVAPGRYGAAPPSIDVPEHLLVARLCT